MADFIREPIQQRSIEKKNKIIQAAYELFAEKGYFNTNTAQIAKRAHVSTGIVYGYFYDKRDILIDVLEIYIKKVFLPIINMFDDVQPPFDLKTFISEIIDCTVVTHRENASIHEALHSLSPTDNLVDSKFKVLEGEMTTKIVGALRNLGYNMEDLTERVHIAIDIIQAYAHETVFDDHSYLNYERMRELTINIIVGLFGQN